MRIFSYVLSSSNDVRYLRLSSCHFYMAADPYRQLYYPHSSYPLCGVRRSYLIRALASIIATIQYAQYWCMSKTKKKYRFSNWCIFLDSGKRTKDHIKCTCFLYWSREQRNIGPVGWGLVRLCTRVKKGPIKRMVLLRNGFESKLSSEQS